MTAIPGSVPASTQTSQAVTQKAPAHAYGSVSRLGQGDLPSSERWPYRGGRSDWGKRLQMEATTLYEHGDKTIAEIAAHLGVTERTVRSKLDLTKRGQRVHDAAVLHAEGLRKDVIAERIGVSPVVVTRYLREAS